MLLVAEVNLPMSQLTSPEGINLDVVGYDLTANAASVLGNISTRAFVQTGDDVMIGGFIIARERTQDSDCACHWSRAHAVWGSQCIG